MKDKITPLPFLKKPLLNPVRPRLTLHKLSLFVHLGCSPTEREALQEIILSIEMQFPHSPLGERTDRLKDTLCYAEVCQTLKNFILGRSFHLIEKLARDCLSVLQTKYPSMRFHLKLHKKKTPVKELQGGVTYTCGENF